MSRLAPVTTGQPTQGMGTVPNGKHVPHQSPIALVDGTPATVEMGVLAPPPPSVNPRSAHSVIAANCAAAWLSLEAKEMEVRDYFKRIPVASGLEILAKMRRQCDMAAQSLQQRMDEGNKERCTGCGKTLEEARKSQFIMQGSEVDPETGVPMPYRYCGVQCVRERNREKMLPPEDRNKKRFDGEDMGDIR